MTQLWNAIFAPGFFSSGPVLSALVVGAAVALVTGAVGVFTVIRRQAFAGHALGEVGSAGGSAAFLGGANPLWGFMGVAVVAAPAWCWGRGSGWPRSSCTSTASRRAPPGSP
jgi:zinc/manganese transport system permease protein